MRLRTIILVFGFGVSHIAMGAELHFDSDRMAVVDGQRTFILGLYETFGNHDLYKSVAEAGFNLVHGHPSADALDHLHTLGLYAWLNTGGAIDLSDDRANREAQLKKSVEQFGDHPALLTWEVPDEALWNTWYAPVQWRVHDEPKQLRSSASGGKSKRRSGDLADRVKRLEALYAQGNFVEGEKVADAMWKAIGKEPPHPELSFAGRSARAETLRTGMIAGYEYLKALDPKHPIWMNHAPRNQIASLAAFNQGADIVGCDMYPAPSFGHDHSDLADQTLSAVGAYTRRMQVSAPGKPIWMVLQGFGWKDLLNDSDNPGHRRPNAHELRFMAYDAIVHGARGILYWGTAQIEKPSQLWKDILVLGRELSGLQPVLSAPEAILRPTLTVGEVRGSVDRGVEMLTKDVAGSIALVIVNEWVEPLDYRISGLNSYEGQSFADPVQNVRVTVANGEIATRIPAYGVHVLQRIGVDPSAGAAKR